MSLLSKIAIDLGTSNTTIIREGEVILSEPSVVALEMEKRKIVSLGIEAKKMMGKIPDYVEIISPLEYGAIVDFEAASEMLMGFLGKIMGSRWFIGPEMLVPVACGTTQVEQRAVYDVLQSTGGRKIYLVDMPVAAALGAKISISEPFGNMIVNFGGGLTEVAVIASGGVVAVKTMRRGGVMIDQLIDDYLKKEYSLTVGSNMVEKIKVELGSVIKLKKEEKLQVGGRDLVFGLPKSVQLSSDEIYEVVRPHFDSVIELVKSVLAETPPELVADVIDRGIVLTGRLSQLRNLSTFLTREIGVPVHVAIDPEYCVVRGASMILENIDEYHRSIR